MRDKAFKMGVANGTLFEVVLSIIQPGTVLSAFFLRITGSTFFSTLPFALMHIGDRYGNRLLQLISTLVYLTVPALALASYHLPSWRLDVPVLRAYDLRAAVFVLAFILSAVANKGRGMGSMNYLLDISPEGSRPSYMAFMSVLLAPAALVPLVAGSIAELVSFQTVFGLTLVFVLASLALIARLEEPRRNGNMQTEES